MSKTILITGGAGFLGSHLSERLAKGRFSGELGIRN
jgi:nucleoside-diphosphate-sugar epimerase